MEIQTHEVPYWWNGILFFFFFELCCSFNLLHRFSIICIRPSIRTVSIANQLCIHRHIHTHTMSIVLSHSQFNVCVPCWYSMKELLKKRKKNWPYSHTISVNSEYIWFPHVPEMTLEHILCLIFYKSHRNLLWNRTINSITSRNWLNVPHKNLCKQWMMLSLSSFVDSMQFNQFRWLYTYTLAWAWNWFRH